MTSELIFFYNRLNDKLWLRPLIASLFAIAVALAAAGADHLGVDARVPKVERDTVEQLLSIIAASMLGIATFTVGSMVSAYGSASSQATPRALSLVIADDVSKNVLSTFIASFIFSVVSLVSIKSDVYGRAGIFLIFVFTIATLAWVVVSFIGWSDRIARLGRVGNTTDRVEAATETALRKRKAAPYLGAAPLTAGAWAGKPVYSRHVGYVQHVDVEKLQACACKLGATIIVAALPGTFIAPGKELAVLADTSGAVVEQAVHQQIEAAFAIGGDRLYDEDPRFGLIVLSEIAARALSPAVNDPGTAIDIIGTFVRLFAKWVEDDGEKRHNDMMQARPKFDRVFVPALDLDEMLSDAFTAIAREGAGSVEVMVRLQKALLSLSSIPHEQLQAAARTQSELAVSRAQLVMKLPQDLEAVRRLANTLLNQRSAIGQPAIR